MKLAIMTILALGATTGLANAANVAPAKAAELGVHRIERLVTLKKIDQAFMDKFSSLQIESLTQGSPADPAFKVTASQVAGPDGKRNQVEILMDGTGKALSNTVKQGTDAVAAPRWSDKDPVSLTENAMHVILEGATTPKLKPYFTGFTSVELTQDRDASGQTIARFKMRSKDSAAALEVLLKADGTVISSQIAE
jgi:hypothetical protein